MSLMLILEAAGRSLVMGLFIGFALRVMRIRQVRAQRAAWLLALSGALAMPLLAGLQIGPQVLPAAAVAPARLESLPASSTALKSVVSLAAGLVGIYVAVSGLLLLRLGMGWATALRIRRRAMPIDCPLGSRLDVRVSESVAAPVTIASSIVLPSSYALWPTERLRIVLSHESAHVRQRDFDVQLLAGLHCALFWFSPFSWWLRRQLADLGEALSDHAAVQHADSRASYAEILLSFASGPASMQSVPSAAVAMARSSNLSARIERLLSDGFHQCFASRPRSLLVAAAAAVMALAAATSVSRVQAAAHGVVHSDEMYAGNDLDGGDIPAPPAIPEPPPAPPAAPALVAVPPAPPPAPAAPPAVAPRAEALDSYARELARAQRQLEKEAERLERQRAEFDVELEQHRSAAGAELAHAQQRMAAAQRQLALQMQSPEMKALREQQSKLSRQMSQLAEQQIKLIEQAMRAFDATINRAVQGRAAPET